MKEQSERDQSANDSYKRQFKKEQFIKERSISGYTIQNSIKGNPMEEFYLNEQTIRDQSIKDQSINGQTIYGQSIYGQSINDQSINDQPIKRQSDAKGFAILSIAGILVKVLSLLYIPFLLVIIGEEGNGIYAAAYQVYVLIYVISNAGFPVAISKLVSELTALGRYKDAFRSFQIARVLLLTLGIFMSILMFVLSKPLAGILHFEKSYLAILALSPTLIFASISSAYRGYFQGLRNMTPTAVSQVIEQVFNTVFTLVFTAILIKFGIEAACAGGTVGTSLGALVAAIYLIKLYNKRKTKMEFNFIEFHGIGVSGEKREDSFKLLKKLVYYSIPITASLSLQYAGNLIDLGNTKIRLLAAGFNDTTATQLYSHLYKYQQLLNGPIAVVAALAVTILPSISAAAALKDKALVENRIKFAYRLCFLVTIPSAVGFAVLSTPLYKVLAYGPGAELMFMGSICLVLLALVQIQTSILQGVGKLYTVTCILVLGILGKIITNYFLIANPQINVYGAIVGSVVGYLVTISLNQWVLTKHLGIQPQILRLVIKPLMASVLMGLSVHLVYLILATQLAFIKLGYLVNIFAVLVSIAMGVLVYFTCMVGLRGIATEDLDILPYRMKKLIPSKVMHYINRVQ